MTTLRVKLEAVELSPRLTSALNDRLRGGGGSAVEIQFSVRCGSAVRNSVLTVRTALLTRERMRTRFSMRNNPLAGDTDSVRVERTLSVTRARATDALRIEVAVRNLGSGSPSIGHDVASPQYSHYLILTDTESFNVRAYVRLENPQLPAIRQWGGAPSVVPGVREAEHPVPVPTDCWSYQPIHDSSFVVGSREFTPPVAAYVNWRGWSASRDRGPVFHQTRNYRDTRTLRNECRPLSSVDAVAVHETAGTLLDNPRQASSRWHNRQDTGGRNNSTQFVVHRDGSIAQHFDVLQSTEHFGQYHNAHTVGIECVNRMSSSSTSSSTGQRQHPFTGARADRDYFGRRRNAIHDSQPRPGGWAR